MREKLNRFLPFYPVTVVLPIPAEKWLIWIDAETGELSEKRKSPKKGNSYQAFTELYKIKQYLKEENLSIRLFLLNMEEYRLLNGWSSNKKKGSSRYDRIPTEAVEEIELSCPRDYMQLIPPDMEEPFTSKEFAGKAKIPARLAGVVLNILFDLSLVTRAGKKGNAYLYEVNDF